MNNKGSIFGTTAFWIILCLIVVFFFGLFVGRSTCTRPSSVPGTTTVTPETPSPQFGSGILTPVPQPPSLFQGSRNPCVGINFPTLISRSRSTPIPPIRSNTLSESAGSSFGQFPPSSLFPFSVSPLNPSECPSLNCLRPEEKISL